MCSILSKHTYFLLKVDLHCNLPHFRNVSNTNGVALPKLDGVAPLMTDPPPISSTTLSEEKKKEEKKVDT